MQPYEGFPTDKRMQKMIDLKVNQLDFGPVYNNCKKALKGLAEQFNELDILKHDLNDFLVGFYSDLKKEVDTRREDLKYKIDHYAEQITENILITEKDCLQNKRKIEENTKELSIARRELDLLILEFDSFEINDKKMNTILLKAEQLRPKLTDKIAACKKFLCGNKSFKFEYKPTNIEDIFGSLKSIDHYAYKTFPSSTILTRFRFLIIELKLFKNSFYFIFKTKGSKMSKICSVYVHSSLSLTGVLFIVHLLTVFRPRIFTKSAMELSKL